MRNRKRAAGSAVRRMVAQVRQSEKSARCGAKSAARRAIRAGRLTFGGEIGDTQGVSRAIAGAGMRNGDLIFLSSALCPHKRQIES